MPGQPVKLGPFVGGLNTYSDTTAVADNEVVELLNFDIDIDGSLVTRPAIVGESATPGPDLPFRLLGYYVGSNGDGYLLAAVARGYASGTYAYYANAWNLITNTFSASSFVQYQNKAWLVAPTTSINPGGSWDPQIGFTPISAMKKGASAVIYKERMWIGEGGTANTSSRLFFSNPGNLAVWNASDFVDVKNGDGQDIVELLLYADTIVVFKQNSTYIFSYDSKPTAGQVRQISSTIGIAARDCAFEYENNLYLFHGKSVYSMANWNYEKLNVKVPLTRVNSKPTVQTVPYVLSRVNDRLILRYYDTYYIFNLKSRVWGIWSTPRSLGRFFMVPVDSINLTPDKFLATSSWVDINNMYSMTEGYDTDHGEIFNFAVTTKSYDFGTPYTYKRLFWWGGDVIAKSNFLGTVFPVTYGRKLTWAQAKTRTWAQAKAFTWGHPADINISVVSSRSVAGTTDRTFIKFLKSLRFRQVNFRISGVSEGYLATSPMRIFGITAFVDSKATVSQTIN